MTRKKPNDPPYTGELAKPILPIPREQLLALTLREIATGKRKGPGSIYERAQAERVKQPVDKLGLLFKHFNIDESNYAALAMALAMRHVPGFSIAVGPPGAKKVWKPFDVALLRFEIEATQAEKGRSFAEAARLVAKRGHWSARLRKGSNPGETLRRRAITADPVLLKMVRDAYAYEIEFEKTASSPTVVQFVQNYIAIDSRLGSNSRPTIPA